MLAQYHAARVRAESSARVGDYAAEGARLALPRVESMREDGERASGVGFHVFLVPSSPSSLDRLYEDR